MLPQDEQSCEIPGAHGLRKFLRLDLSGGNPTGRAAIGLKGN